MAQQTPTTPATLPSLIEVFCAGRHIDDTGTEHNFTEADVLDMATSYNTAIHEAPFTIGHPADNLPAYAWAKGAHAESGRLLVEPDQVDPQFAEMVADGRFKKRSASFYDPTNPSNPTPGHWYLRHVAFLGAQPPAVKGLKEIQFKDSAGCISFSEALPAHKPTLTPKKDVSMPEPTSTTVAAAPVPVDQAPVTQLQTQLAELQTQITQLTQERDAALAQLATIAQAEEVKQAAEIAQFAETMVKEGKLLPKDKAMNISIMTDLAKSKPVQFSEGNVTRTVSKLDAYKEQLKAQRPVVQFGEFAGSSTAVATPASDVELDQLAKQYAAKHNVTYVEALKAVQAGASV